MERESFEDPETAAYMNEHFVNVKVDREERPDVDAIYMEAVQAMSGQGGWPMTVFLDPDGVPFYGGTYFPPDESRGMPSFRMVMEAVVDAFERKRDEIRERAGETRSRLGAVGAIEPAAEPPEAALLEQAVEDDDQHRPLPPVAGAEGDIAVELGTEATAIEEAGERVVIGQVAQLGLGLLGPLQGALDDLAVLGFELVENHLDRRIAGGWKSLPWHQLNVVLSPSRCQMEQLV
jgi:hypothetical protein